MMTSAKKNMLSQLITGTRLSTAAAPPPINEAFR